MFHLSVLLLLKKYYVAFLYLLIQLVFWEHHRCNFPFPYWNLRSEMNLSGMFLSIPISPIPSISRPVSLIFYSWILVLLLFILITLTYSIWLTPSWSFWFLLHFSVPYVCNSIEKYAPLLCLWLFSHICVYAVLQLS